MKKTMKSIIAATLALVMLFCSVPAFAAGADETVKWYWWEDNYHEYHYEGELEEGAVEFRADIPDHIYYTFEAKEEGYYLFAAENSWLYMAAPEEIKDGCFYGEEYADEHIGEIAETDDFASLYYLEAGEHIFGVTYGEGTGSPSTLAECGGFSFEYCGKEVTDLSFGENSLENLVIGLDIVYDEHSSAENEVPYGAFIDDVTVTFSSGKSIIISDNGYAVTAQSNIKEGSNNVRIKFLDYEEDAVITVCPVSHFIKSVELSNVEKYMDVKVYYDGTREYYGDYFIGETVTVTFTDGTKKTCEIDPFGFTKIEFPNGREYYLDASYESVNDDGTSLNIVVSLNYRCDIAGYECNVEQASAKENFELLKYNIEHGTYWEISNIRYAFFDVFEFDSIFEFINNVNIFISTFIANSNIILDYVNGELDAFIKSAA